MAEGGGRELLASLQQAAGLLRDMEVLADLLMDAELLHAVREQANAVAMALHRLGQRAPGRQRGEP